MIHIRNFIAVLIGSLCPLAAQAQDEAIRKVTIRAFLNQSTPAAGGLFVHDSPNSLTALDLTRGELPAGQMVALIDGKLTLFNTSSMDPQKLKGGVVGAVSVPPSIDHAIAIIQPRGDGKPGYGVVLIDDSFSAFPRGESRVVSFTTFPTALQVGEHKIPAASGKITKVPVVKKVDAYNMAQTNFYYKRETAWIPFSESKLKYLDAYRQVFICSVRAGGKSPMLTTLIDDSKPPAKDE